ncbi:MAG: DUF1573 domain-containing protein [Pirellulales bacterium]|nr:DUF1573 domain-containing protein [Pirellulales bacterium]
MRRASATFTILLLLASNAAAQEWARKMFDHTTHDFLGVARGSTVQHRFKLTNPYKEDVHIASVRSSCGCTTPEFNKDTLKTYETGDVIATFNTRAFTGQRGATITVTFDKPFYAEVQLKVSGYIRTDVVLHPAGVAFGSVDVGSPAEERIEIEYAGRGDWKITGIKSPSPYVTAEAVERRREGGNVAYDLVVRMSPDAPTGFVKEQLILVTNDRRETELPVDIEGQVVAPVSVSPASLFLGVLEPGQKVTKQLIVRGKKPFKVLGVECGSDCFTFKVNSEVEKPVHMIPVTFIAGDEPGKVTQKIVIKTNLGDAVITECAAFAQVTRPIGADSTAPRARTPETGSTALKSGS